MSAIYYGLNSWLPDVYVERGWSEGKAGALLAVLNATQIVAGLGDGVARRPDVVAPRLDGGLLGLGSVAARRRAAPGAGFLWAVLLGATIGPLFSLTMALPLDVGHGPAEVAAFTGLMLGRGLLAVGDVAARARRDPRRSSGSASCSGGSFRPARRSSRCTRRSRPRGSQPLDSRATPSSAASS